ncbi:squamosa promoter-binding-like protein 1 [Mercurialis annua]|uniref:squamosa promoter-binding-like protein 1 n=1 Tax=Mercurialis annua TaxID=3986 RepID=UPI0021602B7B|nr:squamosa promoter-binding-like protein 1 [Mercurialis annua]
MNAKIREKSHHLYESVVSDMKAAGKKSLEWDLNDWKWDGDLFIATPLNSVPSDCRSRQLFPIGPEFPSAKDNNLLGDEKGKRELEKRRRAVIVEDEELPSDQAGSLKLKLGGQAYPIMDEDVKCGKKTKFIGNGSTPAVCQVEDCRADLSNAKDYHRRHKVCDTHSKASRVLVGKAMQRFCQQCSRFHLLQEFDEGKRSCRRRLAGHNKRRRKTHPENLANGGSLNDEKGSSYLLISLLRILSNLHTNSSDQEKDQDLLSHLLRNLANIAGTSSGGSISDLLQGSQALVNAGTTAGTLKKGPDTISSVCKFSEPSTSAIRKDACAGSVDTMRPLDQNGAVPIANSAQENAQDAILQTPSGSQSTALKPSKCNLLAKINESEAAIQRIKCTNIDLNNAYDGTQDAAENLHFSLSPIIPGTGSISCPLWMQSGFHKKSSPQMSGNSDSTSSQSPSSSSGDAQSRTDKIVFKLFGKDPNDFPITLRTQILDWLSHSPNDIESYIRPGCIILTIYLRLGKPQWDEICHDLGDSLSKLLDASADSFWRTGWIYARVRNCVSFIYNGQVVLNTPLPLKSNKNCRILSIKPVAVTLSERTRFVVQGFNISRPTTRLLCALEGKYLVQETSHDLVDGADTTNEHRLQCLSFLCSIPNITGRGFIEVEDHGFNSSFFPFIVAEKEVCLEICMLEEAIEVPETADDRHENAERIEAKNRALDFVHEMGWLLHRTGLKSKPSHMDHNLNLFPLKRYTWLIEFSMDHDWCAVVKKLLAILFDGNVDAGDYTSIELALLDMCLLHRAVQRNCRSMVELLLRYIPHIKQDVAGPEQKRHIFKPDAVGPGGLTPLHVAGSRDGSENVLDALTDDPEMVGIEAWSRARDSTGLTPNDYACLRGYYSYIHMIQKKTNKKSENGQVVLDIPNTLQDCNTKQRDGIKSLQISKLEMKTTQCRLCERNWGCGRNRRSLVYRPAMLSMVAIAAVCVCVALLFKSSPQVLYVFQPFRWELLKYGSS